jgi:hypothetical protein
MVPVPGWDMVRAMTDHCAYSGLTSAPWSKNPWRESSAQSGRCSDVMGDEVALVGCRR